MAMSALACGEPITLSKRRSIFVLSPPLFSLSAISCRIMYTRASSPVFLLSSSCMVSESASCSMCLCL